MASTLRQGARGCVPGFTSLELLIAVVVIAVLGALALPSFLTQLRAARRADAIATLALLQQAQERWRAQCPCYAASLGAPRHATNPGGCPGIDCDAANGLGLTPGSARYAYSMPRPPSVDGARNAYTLRATPLGSQALDRAGGVACNPLEVTVVNSVPTYTPPACFRQ